MQWDRSSLLTGRFNALLFHISLGKGNRISNRGLKNQVEQLLLTVTVNKERCFSFSQKWVEDQSD